MKSYVLNCCIFSNAPIYHRKLCMLVSITHWSNRSAFSLNSAYFVSREYLVTNRFGFLRISVCQLGLAATTIATDSDDVTHGHTQGHDVTRGHTLNDDVTRGNTQNDDGTMCHKAALHDVRHLVVLRDFTAESADDVCVSTGDHVFADLANQIERAWLWIYAPTSGNYGYIPRDNVRLYGRLSHLGQGQMSHLGKGHLSHLGQGQLSHLGQGQGHPNLLHPSWRLVHFRVLEFGQEWVRLVSKWDKSENVPDFCLSCDQSDPFWAKLWPIWYTL